METGNPAPLGLFSFGLTTALLQAGVWQGDLNGHAPKHYDTDKAEQMMLALFGLLTLIFAVQTLRMNRALQTLFSLTVHFFLLAGGVVNPTCHKIAGWVGAVAYYAATAILTAEVWERKWLPMGHMQVARCSSKRTVRAKDTQPAPVAARRWSDAAAF
ncbi:hypothetical protein WJX81_000706 [Elliptochloris bilobata]|uniref:Uncharacterized protein n=1 Tax=Elliptochloris bilobata TaxID=381761 RepID=A0AAW1R3Z4_9CHLO